MAGKKKSGSSKVKKKSKKRIPWGSETGTQKVFATMWKNMECPDCGTKWGKKHIPICDVEECPIDYKQLSTCGHMRIIT